jgi:hypothetical protein
MICHDCYEEHVDINTVETSYGYAVCNQCLEDYYFCGDCSDYFYESDFGQKDLCLVCEENGKDEA